MTRRSAAGTRSTCITSSLQDRVDRTPRLPLAQLSRLAPKHAAAVQESQRLSLYAAVAAASGASVVVDSTKRPSTAHLLALDPELDLAVAHVVRDPRGVVNSWNKQVAIPANSEAQPLSRRRSQRQTLRRYYSVNLMIERLRRSVPVLRIRYEDLVDEPATVMREVLDLWGHEPVLPGDLDFLTPDGLLTGASHAVAGGRIRHRTGAMPLRLDENWRRELSGWRTPVTVATAYPLMRRYGYH